MEILGVVWTLGRVWIWAANAELVTGLVTSSASFV